MLFIAHQLGHTVSPVGLLPPVFSGTIPDITGNEGDPNIVTDLSTYFTGATSYSISPSVEAGWNFDTVTGILTVDTDDVNTFGPYIVTGTNGAGSDPSNSFSVVISEVEAAATGGFFFDFDREILRRKIEREERDELKEKAEEIQEELDRALALEFRKQEENNARLIELKRISDLARKHQSEIKAKLSDRAIIAVERAVTKGNFSALEALDRELKLVKEEETFLIDAMKIILSS